ncbi:MAG: hypothetical protein ABH919_02660 [bacterium]
MLASTIKKRHNPETTADLVKKIEIPRKIEELKEGFYLLLNGRKHSSLFVSTIIEIVEIDRTVKNIKVIRFVGQDGADWKHKLGSIRHWPGGEEIRIYPLPDWAFLGIKTDPNLKELESYYSLIPLRAIRREEAFLAGRAMAAQLDVPVF